MSATWSATALIGVKVRGSSLYTTSVVPGCAHPSPPEAVFCSLCGKPTQRVVRLPIAEYDEGKETLCGFPVVKGEEGHCYVGALTLCATDPYVPDWVDFSETLDDMWHRLRAALQPLGLWQEATFGLWAVLGCDC